MKRHFLTLTALFFALAAGALEVKVSQQDMVMKTAESEIRGYVEKMGVSSSPAVFKLAVDPKLDFEEWKIRSVPGGVLLSGGSPRGVLFAVYHYLEDVCGVRWWTPWDETVPQLKTLPVEKIALSGKPFFKFRGVYSSFVMDDGAFYARMRANDEINRLKFYARRFGGELMVGPPGYVNTFAYFCPGSLFEKHPEWFSLLNGKRFKGKGRESDSSQRCLSNKALREHCKVKFREFIRQGEENARKLGIRKPVIYVISQNDGSRWCQCSECQAIIKREGALSGLILDFVNELARDIQKDYPDILIRTAAYNKTEDPPKHIRPEKNVIVSLANMRYNMVRPNTAEDNPRAHELFKGWAKICSHMMMWDYNINYHEFNELAYPSEYFYKHNLLLYKKHGLYGIFAEQESPVHADVREYKFYLWMKLLEDPELDFDKLRRDFADNYYGKAGKLFLEYRDLLLESVKRTKPFIIFTPTPDNYTHLDLETVTEAFRLFDEGEKLLADDPVRLTRWRDAKISLNRSALYRSKILRREYIKKHGSLKGYPFRPEKIAAELRAAWKRRVPLFWGNRKKILGELETALKQYNRDYTEKELAMPARFKHVPPDKCFDFSMENSSRFRNFAVLVNDPESEVGYAAAMITEEEKNPYRSNWLGDYRLPQPFGIRSRGLDTYFLQTKIKKEQVKKAGYNWYKLGVVKLSADAFLYCFGTWMVQQPIGIAYDPKNPDAKFEIWISMKFTGPAYPHGREGDKNAIYIDRVFLIRAK